MLRLVTASQAPETIVMPGTQTDITLHAVSGQALKPRQHVTATLSYRIKADAEYVVWPCPLCSLLLRCLLLALDAWVVDHWWCTL